VNSLAPMEALVNRLTFLTPYLILDLGAGLTPLVQKMISFCNLVFVLAEPVPNAVSHSKMLMDDIADLGISRQCIKVVVVNRIRSDTQINMSQLEELLGQAPVVAITPAPELMYMSARGKTTAIAARPDSLTAQQFNKLATVVLDFEKQK
jgi:MinD-like ATPase involved in chromosome partitioning or flagellar assembly